MTDDKKDDIGEKSMLWPKEAILKFVPASVLRYMKAARYIRHVGRFSEVHEPELKVVKHLVNLGDTVVDVGANVGWYTHYLSRLIGEKGRVISLEPIPETFWLLSVCAKWHRLSNATLVNAGASEEDKVGVMEVPFYEFGGENFYMAHVVDENIGDGARLQRQVRLTTLDSVYKSWRITSHLSNVTSKDMSLQS